jgi:hypothetical protein
VVAELIPKYLVELFLKHNLMDGFGRPENLLLQHLPGFSQLGPAGDGLNAQ